MVLRIVTSSKLKPLLFLASAALLASCAQRPAPTTSSAVLLPDEPLSKVEDSQQTARKLYQLAGNYQQEVRHYHLLKAARQALQEQDYLLALAISENLKSSRYPMIVQQNTLVLLKAYLATQQQHSISTLLDNVSVQALPEADQAEFVWLAGGYQLAQQRYVQASRYLLQLDALDTGAVRYPQYPDLLWQSLSALTDSQLESLRTGASQATLGWLELAQLSRRYIGKPEALQQAFADWQRRYVQLSSRLALPAALSQLLNLTPYQPQRIAVLLPLSGQFRQHAQAIQYGILAAASAQQAAGLVFIDSQQPNDVLAEQVRLSGADFVIGPLLKPQVDRLSQDDNWRWPTLFLNSKEPAAPAKAEQFYFALSMEDEATQMAQLFAQKNYQRPVVISTNSNIALRMQQRFAAHWQALRHSAPEQHQFGNKAELEQLISQLLETDKSRERIKQLNNLIPEKLEADPHSRLDIDAIYLIADPVQTRLFKPFVDVSVSQTAPRLPLYASSRSHSTSLDSTDLRDLNGLTFTEMPWMLAEQNSRALREQYQQLFAEQDETLQRLFAMGVDAYNLVGSLRQQQQLPATVFYGLTGRLQLNASGSLVRQLSWAAYRNNRLVPLQEP